MKICYNCKNQVADEAITCPYCNGQQFVLYNQEYNNGTNPFYQQGISDNVPPERKKRKAPLIVLICAIILCITSIIIYMAFVGARRIKAQNVVKKYIKSIENFDVEGIIYSMVPEDVLDEAFNFYGPTDTLNNGSIDNALEEISDELGKMKGDLKIDFKHVKVGNLKKVDLEEQVIDFAKRLKNEFPQFDMDNIQVLSDELDELIEEIEKYGIDKDKIWIADFEFKVSITADLKKMTGSKINLNDITFNSSDLGINHVYLYEYKGKMYAIPGFEDMIFAPLVKPIFFRIL